MYKVKKLQDFHQLQTVLALYEQENIRNNEPPNYSRLTTSVRRRIDQTMRTRNFRAQNETVERGAVTKSQKREKSQRGKEGGKGRWENAISGKQLDSVRKGTHVVSVMIPRLETDAIRDKWDNRPLPHQNRRHRLTERNPQKAEEAEERALLEQEAGACAEISEGESVRISFDVWQSPVCLNYKSESGCKCGDIRRFRHVEADGQLSKKSKNSGVKGSVSVSRFPCEEIHSTERRKIGIKSHRQILLGHVALQKKSGKTGSIARRISKV